MQQTIVRSILRASMCATLFMVAGGAWSQGAVISAPGVDVRGGSGGGSVTVQGAVINAASGTGGVAVESADNKPVVQPRRSGANQVQMSAKSM